MLYRGSASLNSTPLVLLCSVRCLKNLFFPLLRKVESSSPCMAANMSYVLLYTESLLCLAITDSLLCFIGLIDLQISPSLVDCLLIGRTLLKSGPVFFQPLYSSVSNKDFLFSSLVYWLLLVDLHLMLCKGDNCCFAF